MNHRRFFPVFYLATFALLSATSAWGQASLTVNRMITVAAAGTPAANCASLTTVLSGITDSSSSNPYLVRLEPGLYSCGVMTSSIIVPSFVTVQGAGVDATVIDGQWTPSSGLDTTTGVLDLRNGSELRHLTVQNTGNSGSAFVWAVSLADQGQSESARISNIRAIAGPTNGRSAGLYAVGLTGTSPVLFVIHSYLEGATDALVCDDDSSRGLFRINNSQLVATNASDLTYLCSGDDAKCVYSFDVDYDPIDPDCEPPSP